MNLLNSGGNKKKWIIGGIGAFLILLVILIIIFWDKLPIHPEPEPIPGPEIPDQYIPDGGGNFNPDFDDRGFVVSDTLQYVTPNETQEEIEVISYTDEGSYLSFLVKDKDGNLLQYAVKHETIIFDAKTNKVILPSKLEGQNGVKLLASSPKTSTEEPSEQSETTEPTKEDKTKPQDRTSTHNVIAVIPNAPENLHYTPIYSIEKTEDYVYILNLDTETRYRLSRDARTVNVLSGLEISENDLMFGDRLFIYEGETVSEYKHEVEEDDFISPKLIDYLSTTEGKNSEYFKTTSEDELLSDKFKTVDVSEVYVYPHTAP